MKQDNILFNIFILFLFVIIPGNNSLKESKGKILFVPHDDRPTSGIQSSEPLKMLGYEVLMPSLDLLGGLDKIGQTEKLEKWVKQNIKGAIAAVISSDTMIYGGLVASRRHELSSEELKKRVNVIGDLKRENPQLNIYVFGSLMRTPKSPEYSGDEEPEYYKIYGKQIFERSGLLDKEETDGLTVEEKKKLEYLTNFIPKEIWDDWIGRRKKNIVITKTLIDFVVRNAIDYLIIGKDDNAPLCATHMEGRHLNEYAKFVPKTKFQLLAGIDEFAALLLTRAVNKYENIEPKINVQFNIGKGPKTVPAASDETIEDSINNEIIIINGNEIDDPDKADFVLLVNTNPDGRTGDGDALPDMTAYTDKPRPGTYEFANLVGKMLDKGYKVAIADIAFANSSDNALMKIMKKRGYLMKLRGYAGWNTATNSSGFVIAQVIIALRLQEKDYKRLLMERYLDDWTYEGNVRVDTMNMLYEYGVDAGKMGKYENIIAERTNELMKKFARQYLPEYPQIEGLKFYFPWPGTYTGGIILPE